MRQSRFKIPKREVWKAFKRVKANQGAAGVDGQSIEDFEASLSGNLYKLWNRMSSGSYFPPPVRRVDIPKASGGIRPLGIPTVADRIAQEVARRYLVPILEPVFHPDSFGYRPGKSAIRCRGIVANGQRVLDSRGAMSADGTFTPCGPDAPTLSGGVFLVDYGPSGHPPESYFATSRGPTSAKKTLPNSDSLSHVIRSPLVSWSTSRRTLRITRCISPLGRLSRAKNPLRHWHIFRAVQNLPLTRRRPAAK